MDTYGIIGCPLEHSFSKSFFNQKFADEGIDAEYETFEIHSIESLIEVLDSTPTLRGLNVTIPYKEKVISYIDILSPEAREIGAVNVVKVTRKDGKTVLKGYNTDAAGFTKSIEPLLSPTNTKALVLGTGGASKAVTYGLRQLGIEPVLVSRYQRPGTTRYQDITPEVLHEYNVIVNCTPCGMYPHVDECPALPYDALDNTNILYDLVYNPDQTLFMKRGAARGATVKNGLEMLLLQAQLSWEIWSDDKA